MPTKKKTADEEARAKKAAGRYAALRKKAAPLLADIEKLGGELKAFFREHPQVTQLDEVGFAVTQRKQLDVTAVRAELGERISLFEKINPVETLFLRAGAR